LAILPLATVAQCASACKALGEVVALQPGWETYRRARVGLVSFMNGGGSYDLKRDLAFVLRGDGDRTVALWAALCAVELHFCGNPAHMHTKKRRQ